MRLILTYCFISVTAFSFSQKVSDELMKIREAYKQADYFSADVDVVGWKTRESQNPIKIGTGMLRKTKKEYYSKFGTDEMISNNNCTVIIDHSDKSVFWFEAAKATNQERIPDMDSLLKRNDSVAYAGLQMGLKKFSFYKKDASIVQTDVYVNPETNFIDKIIYFYHESNEEENYDMYKVLIQYKNVNTNKIAQDIFSEKKYITQTKGKLVLAPAYGNYHLTVAEYEKPE